MNTGQYCCSTERVYVVESIAEPFIARVVEKVKALRQGKEGEFDVGPMIWPQQLQVIDKQMDDAVKKGAKVHCGGKRNPTLGDLFYEPTVLTSVSHEMLIMTEETFGPILPIVVVKDEEEAIRLANDTVYGLAAWIESENVRRVHRVAGALEAGTVWVNGFYDLPVGAPFGGHKQSGVGRVGGIWGIREFTRPKNVWMQL